MFQPQKLSLFGLAMPELAPHLAIEQGVFLVELVLIRGSDRRREALMDRSSLPRVAVPSDLGHGPVFVMLGEYLLLLDKLRFVVLLAEGRWLRLLDWTLNERAATLAVVVELREDPGSALLLDG